MTATAHAGRLAALLIVAASLLLWHAGRADVMFNDGIRYVTLARQLDQGSWREGISKAVDHPLYPLGIVGAHRFLGGDSPADWASAGQAASVVAGTLWVIPLYLVAVELYGGAFAWLAVLLALLVPLTGHVFADVLSESTFLHWWTWGVWAALKFLRKGSFVWLPLTVVFAGLAYLTRPEGMLLPLALIGSLALMPLIRSTRLNWPRWWAAVGFLVITPAVLIGPYIAAKGGLGTKPAIARLIGTAPKAPPQAVERLRPLDPNTTELQTYLTACREVGVAIKDGVTLPLLPFVLAGLFFAWPPGDRSRAWLFITLMLVGSVLALIRLQATGGYCTPRHAMIVLYPLITLSAFGLHSLIERVKIPGRWLGQADSSFSPGPLLWLIVLGVFFGSISKPALAPINHENAGYLKAASYLTEHAGKEDRAVDLPGLSLFYSGKQGYTFADLHAAPGDPRVKWVVVREAHLRGEWPYCQRVREIVKDRQPAAVFPEKPERGQSKVFVFNLDQPVAGTAQAPKTSR